MAGIEAVCIDVPFQHFRSATVNENEKDKEAGGEVGCVQGEVLY